MSKRVAEWIVWLSEYHASLLSESSVVCSLVLSFALESGRLSISGGGMTQLWSQGKLTLHMALLLKKLVQVAQDYVIYVLKWRDTGIVPQESINLRPQIDYVLNLTIHFHHVYCAGRQLFVDDWAIYPHFGHWSWQKAKKLIFPKFSRQDHKYKLQALSMLPFFRLFLMYGGCGAVTTAVLVVTLRRTLWQSGRFSRSKASQNVKPYAMAIQPYPKHPDGSPTITMDSYRKLEVIDQDDLYKTFDGSRKSWEKLAVCLCHMSKVGHPWKSFVAKLQGHPVFQALAERDTVTDTSLFLWLRHVSDKDVKRHLMRELVKHQPVPLATAWPQKCFLDELLWTMMAAPALVSLKLNSNVEGVSNYLNQIFDTDFARKGSRFGESQHPFAQIQFDADMKPESRRHFAVIDVHGTTTPKGLWPLELAKSCQFLLLHIKEKDLKSREVQSFVKDISTGTQCKCLFIMIWDDVCLEVREDPQQGFDDEKAGHDQLIWE